MTKVTCSETKVTAKWFHNVVVLPNPREEKKKYSILYWDLQKNPITSCFQDVDHSRQGQ